MSYVVLFTSKLVEADEQYHTLNDALYQALNNKAIQPKLS